MRFRRRGFIILTTIFFVGSICFGGKLPETAKLVPPETILLVNVENFSQMMEQSKKTDSYKLWNDPEMAGFVKKLEENLKQQFSVEKVVLPTGKFAVAVVAGKDVNLKELDMGILCLAQFGEDIGVVKDAVDKQIKKAIESGSSRSVEKYQGFEIMTVMTPVADPVDPGKSEDGEQKSDPSKQEPGKVVVCFVNDVLMVSNDPDLVKFSIAHISGASSPTLGMDPEYSSAMNAVGPYHDIDVYVGLSRIVKLASAGQNEMVPTVLTSLGVDKIKSFSSATGIARKPGSSYSAKMLLKVDGPKTGILKMLECKSAALTSPKFTDPKASSISFLNLDINKAYDQLVTIVTGFNPMMAMMLNAPLPLPGVDGSDGLNLKNDIINHFGSQIVVSESLDKSGAKDAISKSKMMLSVGVSNRSGIESSLGRLHAAFIAPSSPDSVRKFLGYTIYTLDAGNMMGGGMPTPTGSAEVGVAVPSPRKIAITVTDTHLLVAEEGIVEQALRQLSDKSSGSIESAEWYLRAKAHGPQVAGVATISDDRAYAGQIWDLLKNHVGKNLKFGSNIPFTLDEEDLGELNKMFDLSLLPEFDSVKKYFGAGIFHGVSTADGFYFEAVRTNGSEADSSSKK